MKLETRSAAGLREFWAQSLLEASHHPHEGSIPLQLMGRRFGAVSPAALRVIQRLDLAPVSSQCVDLDAASCASPDPTDRLGAMARALHEAGCLPRWRGEMLDVWADGDSIAAVERGAVRALGLLTRAVHLNAWSEQGELWVARRALDKPTDPGLWDTLVGGLVGWREGDDLALERESGEEAGLGPWALAQRTPLRSVTRMKRRLPEGFQCEEVLTSECVLAPGVVPVNRDGEVMQIACLPVSTIISMLLDRQFTLEAGIVIADDILQRCV